MLGALAVGSHPVLLSCSPRPAVPALHPTQAITCAALTAGSDACAAAPAPPPASHSYSMLLFILVSRALTAGSRACARSRRPPRPPAPAESGPPAGSSTCVGGRLRGTDSEEKVQQGSLEGQVRCTRAGMEQPLSAGAAGASQKDTNATHSRPGAATRCRSLATSSMHQPVTTQPLSHPLLQPTGSTTYCRSLATSGSSGHSSGGVAGGMLAWGRG